MCGIVGLFIKDPAFEPRLGECLAAMLIEMTERGPDSTGVAVYRDALEDGATKVTVLHEDPAYPWDALAEEVRAQFGARCSCEQRVSHAVLVIPAPAERIHAWLHRCHPELYITSSGSAIEIFKEKGLAASLVERFSIRSMRGTHALGHTRMATESAVTTRHSHPFSTGHDLCLVHNGSLSNHNRLRAQLRKRGVDFQTDNDSEVAAGYLMWRMREGDSLAEALRRAIDHLDGFYTFAVGSRDGFAVLRDPIGCKPAVMAETDEWAAMASEYRAIATLPGVDYARVWEPEPERVYSWQRSRCGLAAGMGAEARPA